MANLDRKTRAIDQLTEDFTRKIERQWVLDMLRDKHGLSLFAIAGKSPEEVRKRQAAYEADLAKLKEKWEEEDGKSS